MELCYDDGRYDNWGFSYRTSWGGGNVERLQEKLKELRKRKGWTQEDLAHEVGVSLSTIQRWERVGVSRPFRLARRELRGLFQKAGIDAGSG